MSPPNWLQAPSLHAAFDRHPCLLRNAADATSLWSISALDAALTQHELRYPVVRLFRDGGEIPASRYSVEASIYGGRERFTDVDALLNEYAAGATLQIIGLESFHPPVQTLCDAVLAALRSRVERIHVNSYLTPADARGFDHHWDTHDVIVLQLEGSKHWQVHGAPLPLPTPSQVCGPHRQLIDAALQAEPLIDTVLHPGDLLYLPRGQIHAARTASACSLHMTLGLHVWSALARLEADWRHALEQLASSADAYQAISATMRADESQRFDRTLQRAIALFDEAGATP